MKNAAGGNLSALLNSQKHCIENKINMQQDLEIFDNLPDGWKIINGTTAPIGFVHIFNGKSVFSGDRKVAFLKLKYKEDCEDTIPIKIKQEIQQLNLLDFINNVPDREKQPENPLIPKTMQQLARARFKEMLMRDLVIDLTVCKIEGWDLKEYVEDIKETIDDIYNTIQNSEKE